MERHIRITCADCPKYAGCWCAIFVKHSVPHAAACAYGKKLINAAKAAMKRKARQDGNA